VNFRVGALFTCTGASGGVPVATDTARITATATTITVTVTVRGAPGTFVSGQLTQNNCVRLRFFSFTIPPTGVGTITFTDLRISNAAFVWIVKGGVLEITPRVILGL
jgi:hypothetical protein